MTYIGSTRQVEVADQFEECAAVEIYVESLVDPLLISWNLTIIIIWQLCWKLANTRLERLDIL